jgi:hypothetical protein
MITIEDLKDFDTWKSWKNGEVQLGSGGGDPAIITSATVNGRGEWRVYHNGSIIARFEDEERAKEYRNYLNSSTIFKRLKGIW